MTVRLRPHHLLCLLTYAGKGYSRAFTRNYDTILQRIADGEAIELIEGPDDICTPLRHCNGAHCHDQQTLTNDLLAINALKKYFSAPMIPGTMFHLSADHVSQLRQAFSNGDIREACQTCHWRTACTAIALQGFLHTRLWPPINKTTEE
ncbi:MAG: hypothetical protein XXXJIFNMEKO3_03235 [Candidatus Erwinia impunctatus]|nr:hypothetical protein XXXJIFNMEKO_03235 [Culicoides impunctatus]